MINILFKCIKYNNIFRNHHDLNNHIKNNHQSSIKIKFQNDDMIKVKKTKDNIFKYKYEKNFKFINSLHKYARIYNNKLMKQKENEREIELININDFDISKSLKLNDRIISIDCFDALIYHEKC